MSDELAPQSGSKGFLAALVIVAFFAWCIVTLIKVTITPLNSPQVGREFPPIEALGWINESAEDARQLRGRVLVINAWAYWCGPCRMATPMLQHLYEKYKDQQVVFLGLTSEGEDSSSLHESRTFIEAENITWPNAFGAAKTLAALNVDAIPQFWVVDRQNRIVCHVHQGWSPSIAEELERALIQALNAPAQDVPK